MLLENSNLTFDGEYAEIPDYMREPLLAYVNTGRSSRFDFLRAVVSNDLFNSVGRADKTNLALLPLYVRWLYNRAPIGCYGSPEAVAAWIKKGGLEGERA
jgi:hypothetical protein